MRLKRRRPSRRQHSIITSVHETQFRTGFDYINAAYGGFGTPRPLDIDAMREDWESIGDEILSDYITEHPGSRPWAFWQFDHPNEKLCRECGVEIEADGCECGKCLPESDYSFLERRELLTAAEIAAIDNDLMLQNRLGIISDAEFRAKYRAPASDDAEGE